VSNQVTVARVAQFTTDVRHLLQQGMSRMRGKVQERSHRGKAAVAVDQVGKVEMLDVTTRHADTPIVETPHARRWAFPQHKIIADFIDTEDMLELLWDPQGPYREAQAKAAGRKIDQILLAAATGTSVIGETGGSTEAFDTANYQIATGSVGLNTDKIKTAIQKMQGADVDVDQEQIFLAIASKQAKDLMDDPQYINTDYVTDAVLPDGSLKPFMGVNIIRISDNILPLSSTTRSCIMWTASGLHLGGRCRCRELSRNHRGGKRRGQRHGE